MATGVTVESVLGTISQGLECSICHGYYQRPKLLHCSHSFCLKCLQELHDSQDSGSKKMTCPICQIGTSLPRGGVDKLMDNITLNYLVDQVKKQEQLLKCQESAKVMCQACDEEKEANSHCVDCQNYLCQECKKAHQRFAALRNHKISSLAESMQGGIADHQVEAVKGKMSKCDLHPTQILCLFCMKCEQLICKTCSTFSHKEPVHSHVNLKVAMDMCLGEAREIFSHVVSYNSANAALQIPTTWQSSRNRLATMFADTKRQISFTAEMEVTKIKQRETQLLQQAHMSFLKKDRKLAEAMFAERIMGKVHSVMTDADRISILQLRQNLLHDYKDVAKDKTEEVKPQLSFISFKESPSDPTLGDLLLQEKWIATNTSNVTGDFIAPLSMCDVIVVRKSDQTLTKLSPNGKILHVCKTSELEGEDPAAVRSPTDFEVNKDDQLVILLGSDVKIYNKEYKLLQKFTVGEDGLKGTEGTSTCLAVDDKNQIAVGYKDKEKISLHHPDGSLIKTIPAPLIESNLAISNQRFIYTNSVSKKLMGVDYEGHNKFSVQTYQGQVPKGVCCDKAGDIYVGTSSNQIHHHSAEGKYIETLVAVNNPTDIKFTPAGQIAITGPSFTQIYSRT